MCVCTILSSCKHQHINCSDSSKFAGDTETDGENSSIVATPSQSIIALANPTDEDIDDQTTRQTSTESSKQPQQEQDEKPSEQSEGGLGVSGQGGLTEGKDRW